MTHQELLDNLMRPEIAEVKIRSTDLFAFIRFMNKKKYRQKLYISSANGYSTLKK